MACIYSLVYNGSLYICVFFFLNNYSPITVPSSDNLSYGELLLTALACSLQDAVSTALFTFWDQEIVSAAVFL